MFDRLSASPNFFTHDLLQLQDINRRVVKQASASFRIPELEFESEAFSQKGGMHL